MDMALLVTHIDKVAHLRLIHPYMYVPLGF